MTDQGTPRPRRSQPLDWAVVEPLAGRAQDIAKGWLLLLLERAPLEAAGAIPAAALAAEGPALCAAFVRALGSEGELERLRPHGALGADLRRIGLLTGAADASGVVAAVDALRAVVWSAALDGRLDDRDPRAVQALAERLAAVAALVAETAVGEEDASSAPVADASPTAASHAAATAPPFGESPAGGPAAAPGSAPPHGGPAPRVGAPPYDMAIPLPPQGGRSAASSHAPAPGDDLAAFAAEGALGPAERLADPASAGGSVTELPPRPAALDARHETAAQMEDGDLWIATLERHVDRCQREGGGLALLRVELVDGKRVAASAPDGQGGVPYGRLAQAIRRAIRRQDLVASDHEGRAWVIAPGVGRAGAIALAERIAAGVEEGDGWRGSPLAATIGFAVYAEDGRDAATLIERGEEAMLAAAAAGVRIGEAIPAPDDDPAGPAGPRLVR